MLNGRIGSTLLLVQRRAIWFRSKLPQSPSHVPRIFESSVVPAVAASGQAPLSRPLADMRQPGRENPSLAKCGGPFSFGPS
jgi:hypothetical protein